MTWLAFLSLAKFGYYLGFVTFIGFNAMRVFLCSQRSLNLMYIVRWEEPLARWQWLTLGVALICALSVVPVSAGMLMDDGLSGITDSFMLQIAWESSVGMQEQGRLLALLLACISTLWMSMVQLQSRRKTRLVGLVLLTILALGFSFTLSGHTAEQDWLAKALVMLHVLMAGWWIGSFYPLLRLCDELSVSTLQSCLHRYGKQAMLWVGLLLSSGVALLLTLIVRTEGEINPVYLWVMGAKLTLVLVMLLFAAYHKWRLVPQLHTPQDCLRVKRSVQAEALVGMLVLLITALLTSSIGIAR